jgi:hypothetical protein
MARMTRQSAAFLTLMTTGLTVVALPPSARSPSGAQVTNSAAFTSGAGNQNPNLDNGAQGSDSYTCYSGGWQNYPDESKWVSFNSMWEANQSLINQGCSSVGASPENTPEQTQAIHDGILQVSQASLVDPRFPLAIVIQEVSGVHIVYRHGRATN